ncbi:MAG: redox-regulated ATPase YchF [Candidatus Dasytiphilus stammeri]
MIFKCGIIGLPNVGKSTLFKSLTQSCIKVSNYPFCTIKPNVGVVPVPDIRLNILKKLIKTKLMTPAIITFIDIAGLVKGSSQGEGLGNKFLSHIRETTALIHIVRCFKNENIIHVRGIVNPKEDIELINTELALADLQLCESALDKQSKIHNKSMNQQKDLEIKILEKMFNFLDNIKQKKILIISEEEKYIIKKYNFLTLKPVIYVANINKYYLDNKCYVQEVYKIAQQENTHAVTICSVENSEKQIFKTKKLQELIFPPLELNKVIRSGYHLLNLITYFTVSSKEVKAWSIVNGSTAYQAARKIHTDFQKRFIRAKIISFKDFIAYKGEQGAKLAGKMRIEGKKYIIQDGDIIHIISN